MHDVSIESHAHHEAEETLAGTSDVDPFDAASDDRGHQRFTLDWVAECSREQIFISRCEDGQGQPMRLFVDHVSDRAVATDHHDAPSRPLQVRICKHVSSLDRIREHPRRQPTAHERGDQIVHESSVWPGATIRVGHDRHAVPLIGSGRERFHAGGF